MSSMTALGDISTIGLLASMTKKANSAGNASNISYENIVHDDEKNN